MLDNGDMSGRHLVDVFGFLVEDGHKGNAFGGKGDEFLITKIETGTDTPRIAEHKGIAIADDTGYNVTTVPVPSGFAKDACGVQSCTDALRDFTAGDALIPHCAVEVVVHLVELVADGFEQRLCVSIENGMLAIIDQLFIELKVVRNVEIPSEHQAAGGPTTGPQIGMAAGWAVAA